MLVLMIACASVDDQGWIAGEKGKALEEDPSEEGSKEGEGAQSFVGLSFSSETIDVGPGPLELAIAPMWGFGFPEIIVNNYTAARVSIVTDAGFGDVVEFPTGAYPNGIGVGDLNDDSVPDVVTANAGSNDLTFLLSQGASPHAVSTMPYLINTPLSVLIGEIDQDGEPDVVIAGIGALNAILSSGAGAPESFAAGGRRLAFADVMTYGGWEHELLATNATGFRAFAEPATFSMPTGQSPWDIDTLDIDLDGDLDVVTSNPYDDSITISETLPASPNGSVWWDNQTFGVGDEPWNLDVGDVDGDGIEDLAVTSYNSNDVYLLLGDGEGGFSGVQTLDTGRRPYDVQIADIDLDGVSDVAVTNFLDGTVTLFHQL